MFAENNSVQASSVERLPSPPRSTVVSDELNMISASLREACPPESTISFHFNGKLRVHIDVRKLEDVTSVEAILPTLGASMFHDIQRGQAPHHSFFHRVSAMVDR